MSDTARPLLRVIIKEEFVQLLNSYQLAIVLNQILYWQERVWDFDKYQKQIYERWADIPDDAGGYESYSKYLTNGWIYKKAEELSEECLTGWSHVTTRKYLSDLVELGYLEQRSNPNIKWDRTLQYRVNIKRLYVDLQKMGFSLEGWKIIDNSNVRNLHSDVKNLQAIPEITSEITKNTSAKAGNNDNSLNAIFGGDPIAELDNIMAKTFPKSKPSKKAVINRSQSQTLVVETFKKHRGFNPIEKGGQLQGQAGLIVKELRKISEERNKPWTVLLEELFEWHKTQFGWDSRDSLASIYRYIDKWKNGGGKKPFPAKVKEVIDSNRDLMAKVWFKVDRYSELKGGVKIEFDRMFEENIDSFCAMYKVDKKDYDRN